jgi:pimeloyl-ACP methyl ester carboxylesterase
MPNDPERFDVPVAGGELAAWRWPGEGPLVVAAHGITSNHRSWGVVAQALEGRVRLVAHDQRGRGRSNGLPGPYTIEQLADDVAAILDHLGEDRAVIAGHSMGGFVATTFAVRHPQRAQALVIVDGGAPFHIPAGTDLDEALAATLGPALERLDMTFDNRGAYRAFWQQHPAFGGIWSAEVDAQAQHDLVGEPPDMRSSCVKEAVRVAGRDLLAGDDVRAAIKDVRCPMTLLWAPRGMVDQPGGFYTEQRLNGLPNELVPDTNHYSILLGEPGAGKVAAAIRRASKPAPGTPT